MYSIWGTGTKLYGSSNKNPRDGSYVATKWVTIAFIPIIPLGSYRVLRLDDKQKFTIFPPGIESRTEFRMIETELNWPQIIKTYMVGILALALFALIYNISTEDKSVVPFSSTSVEKVFNSEEYFWEKLRLFRELESLQEKWIELEEEAFGITSTTEEVDWKKLNEKGEFLLKEVTNIVVHYDEDREKIHNETDEENLKKLESFLRQSFIYVDVLQRTVMKLSLITNHLYKMTIEPGSWSAKEYLKELDQYKSLCDEYHEEGDKMNEELEKMRNVTLKIK